MTEPIKAAAYYRMSTDRQEDSIDRQRSQVEPYAARHGYQVVAEYVDEGLAGDLIDKRPAFQRMRRDAERVLFQVILCDDKDRFGRFDLIDQGEIVAPLRRAGVRLETVAQGKVDWNTFTGRITDAILQEAKKMESQAISRRVLTSILLKVGRGEWPNGFAPYGYRIAEVEGIRRLVPGDSYHVEVVRWTFNMMANRCWTVRQIRDELYLRGVAPPKGNGWGKTKQLGRWETKTIRDLLRNRVYAGDLVYNKVRQGKYSEFKGGEVAVSDLPIRKNRKSSEAELIVRANTHEPLIDRDTFQKAQEALTKNRKLTCPKKSGEGRYLLTRMLVCGHCGAFLTGREDEGRRSYYCSTSIRMGKDVCPTKRVRESVILDQIVRVIQREFLDSDKLKALREEMLRQEEEKRRAGEPERLRSRAAELASQIDRGNANLALLPADRLPGVVAKMREWEAERDRSLRQANRLEKGVRQREIEETVRQAEQHLWRLREAFASSDPADVQAVLREVVDRVELHFDHERRGQRTYSLLRRGTIYVRISGSHFGSSGCGTTQVIALPFEVEVAA